MHFQSSCIFVVIVWPTWSVQKRVHIHGKWNQITQQEGKREKAADPWCDDGNLLSTWMTFYRKCESAANSIVENTILWNGLYFDIYILFCVSDTQNWNSRTLFFRSEIK